ncbi:MAG: hypothetical protein ACRD4E_13340 [Bryobacteraceae bacterium]
MKRYLLEFGGSMAGYTVLVPVSIWLLRRFLAVPWRYPIAMLPVIPAAFAMWAVIRGFRNLDELQRRIHFEAVVFSFLATCLPTLTWGFLQDAGLPQIDVLWVAPLLIVLWGLGLCIAHGRYQ